MTEQEQQWFTNLIKDREDSAKTLEKPSMSGFKRSVSDKYSEQAHFIYELLQNADDVQATKCSFILEENGLYFSHNGKIKFSISNPETEYEDRKKGILGHINSICSVGNSSKANEENDQTIGKFGVGFKAVFQYTQTPYIYEDEFKFRIERFFVPEKLNEDNSKRKTNETLFYFPFDKKGMPNEQAFSEILEKLKKLSYPNLFLSHLQKIEWETAENKGVYSKKIIEQEEKNDILRQKIQLSQQIDSQTINENIILFTRKIEEHAYCIGYFLDNENKLQAKQLPAFCFFPTQKETKLNFIIHAPFLLTDSREGIKVNEPWNIELIQKLAELAADSLPILRDLKLIDDNIINIIPYKKTDFCDISTYNSSIITTNITTKYMFYPFFEEIKKEFQTESLLPAQNGEYVDKEHAYWATALNLTELFSNKQLTALYGDSDAKWVFTSFGSQSVQHTDKDKAAYISDLTSSRPSPQDILGKISTEFTQQQSFEWLHKLYAYLTDNGSFKDYVKTKPIFKDSEGQACCAFKEEASQDMPVLFLPTDTEIKSFRTIHNELLANEKSKKFIIDFGIKEPDLKDEIYNHILPLYEKGGDIDTETHFKKFFKYYKNKHGDKAEIEKFIALIKDKEFVSFKSKADNTTDRGLASKLYYPTNDLLKYFEPKPDTRFVDLDDYDKQIDALDKDLLKEFLLKLGVSEVPRIITQVSINNHSKINELSLTFKQKRRSGLWSLILDIVDIDGRAEAIKNITPEISIIIWNFLSELNKLKQLKGVHQYAKNTKDDDYEEVDITILKLLRGEKWLVRQDGVFVAPSEITIKELNDGYDVESMQAKELIELLQFKPLEILTEGQKASRIFKKYGFSLAKIEQILAREKEKEEQNANIHGSNISDNGIIEQHGSDNDNEQITPTDKTIKKIKEKISQRNETNASDNGIENNEEKVEPQDEDFYTKPTVDFEKKRKYLENKAAEDIDKITKIEELTKAAQTNEKYSFAWFKALLQLELLNNNENSSSNKKDISITFNKIEREQGTNRTLILTQPNRFIPQYIEEFSGVPLNIELKNGETLKIELENFSVKEYILKAKIKSANEIAKIDFSQIAEGTINVKNAEFLLDALVKCFNSLKLKNTDNLKTNPPQNIEFIFGPPGTGKTTYLSEKILIQLMQQSNRVLVLTPTNKAADVLTKRIIEKDKSGMYKNWLVRFGTTADDIIEKELLVKERSFNLDTLENSVVVSTISRFTYDTFDNGFGHKPLYDFKWDYIVVDEASMIHLPSMVFVLYKQQPQKFIIAGDPFQIGPIANVEQWKDENIYTMVELNKPDAFINPQPKPHNFKITPLTTQWRSIEAIGKLFSEFTYNGRLEHYRKNDDIRKLSINSLDIKPLTFIKFPVSKYESIYRSKLLGKSSYHIYSAIFAFEFVKFITDNIKPDANDKKYNIGIISPYRIQADIVNRLVASIKIHDNINIQVGTVHGFQGDECEIIIALFNTPPFISDSPNSFVNRQTILNVSISRAKDYLFVMMPDNNTDRIENLAKINKLEKLSQKDSSYYLQYNSFDIEKTIFNNSKYIESITFSTTHQNVNIYSEVEKVYEVRGDDNAIDIQLRNEKTKTIVSKETKDVEVFKTDTETQEPQKPKIVGKIDLNKIK